MLPALKTKTRLSRLESYAKRLSTVRSTYSPSPYHYPGEGSFDNFIKRLPRPSPLPPPPFLVVAVIEVLLRSRYAGVTKVVPAEADSYCASAAALLQAETHKIATVFTNDSDLLVLDSGAGTRIVMLDTIERGESPSGICFSATVFTPSDIAEQAGLQNMFALAFLMDEDPHLTFGAAVVAASNRQKTTGAGYVQFEASFTQLPFSDIPPGSKLQGSLDRMDPRISELAYQFLPERTDIPLPNITVYLPILLDDPPSASAWRCGQSLRTLAYMAILSCNPDIEEVHEYQRKGKKILPNAIGRPLPSLDAEMHDQITRLVRAQTAMIRGVDPTTKWRLIGMNLVIEDLREQEKVLPTPEDVVGALIMKLPTSWAQLHLKARLESVLYSLRMLQKVVELLLLCPVERCRKSEFSPKFRDMQSTLTTLPGILDLFDSSAGHINEDTWASLADAYIEFDCDDESEDDSADEDMAVAGDDTTFAGDGDTTFAGDEVRTGEPGPPNFANNPFSSLASDHESRAQKRRKYT